MGLPMVRNLLLAGVTVHAWNRTLDRAKPLADDGAELFEDAAAAADGCPLMITMLSDADSVLELPVMEGVVTRLRAAEADGHGNEDMAATYWASAPSDANQAR